MHWAQTVGNEHWPGICRQQEAGRRCNDRVAKIAVESELRLKADQGNKHLKTNRTRINQGHSLQELLVAGDAAPHAVSPSGLQQCRSTAHQQGKAAMSSSAAVQS